MLQESKAGAVEQILRSWLDDRDLTLFCGDWRQGGIMELIPRGRAVLTGSRYEPPFEGLRELRLPDAGHHVHLDLGRLTKACYTIAPSVCYGFRPSFELRLTSDDGSSEDGFGLGLSLTSPYLGTRLRYDPVRRYLRRVADHQRDFPGVVRFDCRPSCVTDANRTAWDAVARLLGEVDEISATLRNLETCPTVDRAEAGATA